jgi:hypothetical protein
VAILLILLAALALLGIGSGSSTVTHAPSTAKPRLEIADGCSNRMTASPQTRADTGRCVPSSR